MAKTARTAAAAMALTVAVLATPRASAAADTLGTEPNAKSHVRSTSPAIVALIRQAAQRSVTFDRMVTAIDASDAIVFVEQGSCGHGVRACFVSVSATTANRYMRVIVDTHKTDLDLMGSIGHELRHTLEVIATPGVRDDATKFFFYERTAMHLGSGAHETLAAQAAGNAVRDEIKRFNRKSQLR